VESLKTCSGLAIIFYSFAFGFLFLQAHATSYSF
jgi:hypothetical protein